MTEGRILMSSLANILYPAVKNEWGTSFPVSNSTPLDVVPLLELMGTAIICRADNPTKNLLFDNQRPAFTSGSSLFRYPLPKTAGSTGLACPKSTAFTSTFTSCTPRDTPKLKLVLRPTGT